jgi:hypothetical protein
MRPLFRPPPIGAVLHKKHTVGKLSALGLIPIDKGEAWIRSVFKEISAHVRGFADVLDSHPLGKYPLDLRTVVTPAQSIGAASAELKASGIGVT